VQNLDELPSIYITDGHEYAVDYLGAAVNVLDNLIAAGQLRPAIAVFVDPRNPDNLAQNRRAEQYISNPNFASFVADELVPLIDSTYPTDDVATERSILGTSLGGLNAAFFGATRSDVFGNLGIQSPAFSADPSIYNLMRNAQLADRLRIHMTTGTMSDNGGATTMAGILSSYGYDFVFQTVNQGHSWGSWRGQLDDILQTLIGTPVPEPGYPVGMVTAGMLVGGVLLSARRQRRMSF
jgi:enterochelin esterase family protein